MQRADKEAEGAVMLSAAPIQRLHSAFAALQDAPEDEEKRARVYDALWECVAVCEGCPFATVSGLPFTYAIKTTRRGVKGSELVISRKEKTVTRSSVLRSLDAVLRLSLAQGTFPVTLTTPKQLGTFGASYIFPLFIRFGLTQYADK